MSLTIWFRKPRTFNREVNLMKTELIDRRITTITEDTLLDPELKIPITPYIHGEGLQDIIANGTATALIIANLLITGLKETKQKNVVTVSIKELTEKSKLSKPTIINAVNKLEDMKYLTRVGKQSYKVSPRLAWYGNQVDWAIALKEE